MNEASPEEVSVLDRGDGDIVDVRTSEGMSPYATGGPTRRIGQEAGWRDHPGLSLESTSDSEASPI